MKQWKRLAFFLLINIFVSACTTMGILFAWDRLRTPMPGGLIQPLAISFSRPATPTPPPPVATDEPAVTPAALFDTYTVKDGDTFDSIAQTYGVSIADLVAVNGYSQPQTLSPGELLRIPLKPAVIDSVIGAGDLNTEHVVILNNLDGQLSLGVGSSKITAAICTPSSVNALLKRRQRQPVYQGRHGQRCRVVLGFTFAAMAIWHGCHAA